MAAIIEFGFNDRRVINGLASLERRMDGFGRGVSRQLGGVFASLGAGFALRGAVEAVNTYDRMGRALSVLEGSAAGAQQRMALLRETAKLPGLGFEQAVQGDVRLRSVGISAELSRRALVEMGNALALAGGTASDLDGVILALTQIISKGKVSAEEINQIAERVPQVRAVMKDMFGTADTEVLQKMNMDAETFVATLIDGFGKLDRAQAGNTEKMEDFATAIKAATVAFSEGFVGQGVDGMSKLAAVLDNNNSAIRDLGSNLSGALADGIGWVEKAGSGLGQLAWEFKNLGEAMLEGKSIEQYEAEYNEILLLNQAMADRVELERQYQAAASQSPPADPLARPDEDKPAMPGTSGAAKPDREVEDAMRKQEALAEAQKKMYREQMTNEQRIAELRRALNSEAQDAALAAYGTLSGPQGDALRAEAEMKKIELQRELNSLLKQETEERRRSAEEAEEAAKAAAEKLENERVARAELADQMAILAARAAGDEQRAAAMERELRIRERAAQIEAQTGATAAEARRAAESMERFRDQIAQRESSSRINDGESEGRRRGHIGGVKNRRYMQSGLDEFYRNQIRDGTAATAIGANSLSQRRGPLAPEGGPLSGRHARNVGSSDSSPEPTRDILKQLLTVTAKGFNG